MCVSQTEETPLHYCARQGDTAALLVMLSLVAPSLQQGAVNKHYKVRRTFILTREVHLLVNLILIYNVLIKGQ